MNKPKNIDNPLVSVILPVYNGENYLAEAIESVLDQNYHPLEIIIVDDGSTDSTAEVISKFEGDIHYYYQLNSGPASARNFGIRKAKGDFIAFIDSDDLWPKDKLIQQMNCFNVFPKAEIIQGLIRRIKILNMATDQNDVSVIDSPFIFTNLGAMVMRRSVFEKIGFFDESLTFHEDTDFWLRAREAELNILIQRKLALIYRIHGQNMTTGKDGESTGFLNILRSSIARRRRVSGFAKEIRNLIFISDLLSIDKNHIQKEVKTSKPMPLVSIILYANNELVKIDQAIESIRDQNYHLLELLIVSSSMTEIPVFEFNAHVQVHLINGMSNLASGLNEALGKAKGDLIAFLDAEGVWPSWKLKTQINFLLENPADGYVVGRTRNIIMPDLQYPPGLIDEHSLRKSIGDLLSTLMVRRLVIEQVGDFNSEWVGMEETDWLLRARDLGFPQKMLPEVFLYRYVQPDYHVVGIDKMKSALLGSVRSSVQRKRKNN